MSSNFILGNIEVRDYMVEARSRQGNISRMYNSISRTKSIDRWEMGKQKLEDKMSQRLWPVSDGKDSLPIFVMSLSRAKNKQAKFKYSIQSLPARAA
mmetsp:Transcript_17020/g.27851  ORF Transcript_17020/g.27851 Transcript_17020/m.27851 type:complete len:97 (+) Transcript_17020:547-837(+)